MKKNKNLLIPIIFSSFCLSTAITSNYWTSENNFSKPTVSIRGINDTISNETNIDSSEFKINYVINDYITIESFYYEIDSVNPQMLKFECLDEFKYYGELLNKGLVRNVSLCFTVLHYQLDGSTRLCHRDVYKAPISYLQNSFSIDFFSPFCIRSQRIGHIQDVDGYLDSYKYLSDALSSFQFSLVLNNDQDAIFNFSDYIKIEYDSISKTWLTQICLDSASVPSMDDPEIGIYAKSINLNTCSPYIISVIHNSKNPDYGIPEYDSTKVKIEDVVKNIQIKDYWVHMSK